VAADLDTHHQKQGYVDAGKDSLLKLSPKAVVDQAMYLLARDPTQTRTFIRDPNGVFNEAELEKLAKRHFDGRYSTFSFDTNDDEIFADGPAAFYDMEWGYYVTRAIANGQNDAVESSPPKVSVEKVKGKSGDGWKISISKPFQFYLDAGQKAGELEAARLAKKKVFPTDEPSHSPGGRKYTGAYEKVRAKFAK
jgi:hypothetical protein